MTDLTTRIREALANRDRVRRSLHVPDDVDLVAAFDALLADNDRLRDALRDVLTLLPVDRWALLHQSTQATAAIFDIKYRRRRSPRSQAASQPAEPVELTSQEWERLHIGQVLPAEPVDPHACTCPEHSDHAGCHEGCAHAR